MLWQFTCQYVGGWPSGLKSRKRAPRQAMYSNFYSSKQDPFRLTPDPRFLHLAEPHRNTLRAMVEGVVGRKGLQIAIGPIGTGKTTLLIACSTYFHMRPRGNGRCAQLLL